MDQRVYLKAPPACGAFLVFSADLFRRLLFRRLIFPAVDAAEFQYALPILIGVQAGFALVLAYLPAVALFYKSPVHMDPP